jgi:hypothetical protein
MAYGVGELKVPKQLPSLPKMKPILIDKPIAKKVKKVLEPLVEMQDFKDEPVVNEFESQLNLNVFAIHVAEKQRVWVTENRFGRTTIDCPPILSTITKITKETG